MRRVIFVLYTVAVLITGIVLACTPLACSRAGEPEAHIYKVAQKQVQKGREVKSESQEEPTHLEPAPPQKSVPKGREIKSTAEEEPTELNPVPPQKPAPKKKVPEPSQEEEPPHPEPVPEKVTEPKAKITAPVTANVKSYVVLDFAGTVSSIEPDFDVVFGPEGSTSSVTKLYNKDKLLVYGLFIPEKAGKYRIALVAFATNGGKAETARSYAFVDITVADPGKPPEPNPNPPTPGPLPTPPGPEPPLPTPPGPTPPQPAKKEDTYGMYAYTKDLLSQMPTKDAWQSRVPKIYDSFDKMIAQSSTFTDATKFVQATSDLYKSALGKDYDYFSYYFFKPLKAHLGEINGAGTLPSTVEAHAEAWREISQALHEVKIPASTKRSPARSAH